MNEPITVIIPAYNEESSVGNVIKQLKISLAQDRILHEIIVVDDGSKDETSYVAQNAGAKVIRHMKNIGYGAALKTGIRAAQHELIVITDADGTYPVDRIPEILDKLQTADMVVGARVSGNVDIPFVRRPAKWILRRLAGYITGERIPDLNSGLRAFRRRFAQQYFNILPDKFSFTSTITVAALCDHYKVLYVPIDYHKRSGKSKIVPWNFIEFVTLVIRLSMLFNPLKVFVPAALISLLLGGVKLLFDIIFAIQEAGGLIFPFITHKVMSASALILLLSGLQILLIGMMADGITRKIVQHSPQQHESCAINILTTPINEDVESTFEQAATYKMEKYAHD